MLPRLAVHPCVGAPGTLRVWVRAFEQTAAPQLQWWVDGHQVPAHAIRALESVRGPELLDGNPRRAFTGVYDLPTGDPNRRRHVVEVYDGNERVAVEMAAVPADFGTPELATLNVLIVSCYHWAEDQDDVASQLAAMIPAAERPHLTLLVGDQVYLDLPTLANFDDDDVWLAEKFEADYERNWRSPQGYARLLDLAPTLCLPDDHEYWNNYPEASPIVQNSLRKSGRDRWARIARRCYQAFQHFDAAPVGTPRRLDIGPLSFFVADTRSDREMMVGGKANTLTPAAARQLAAWGDELVGSKRFGVFIAGQSLFTSAASKPTGTFADWELPNYSDYERIVRTLDRMVRRGADVMCITGDVHWGRVSSFKPDSELTGTPMLYEVISSPASLVTNAFSDPLKRAFGQGKPWPRHSEGEPTPSHFAPAKDVRSYSGVRLHPQHGNHVCMLSFRKHGAAVDVEVRYYELRSGAAPKKLDNPLRLNQRH